MSNESAAKKDDGKKGGKSKLLLIVGGLAVLLAGGAVGAAFFLKLPPFAAAPAEAHADAEPQAPSPIFVEIPDIVANLNAGTRRQSFVRLKARIEVARRDDIALTQAAMPRLLDLFTTYLRETRPEELRGSVGTHRLREELIARANIATRPGVVTDILFVELIVQ
jgi:flagellar FliL protein